MLYEYCAISWHVIHNKLDSHFKNLASVFERIAVAFFFRPPCLLDYFSA